jgi:hypothetical protein
MGFRGKMSEMANQTLYNHQYHWACLAAGPFFVCGNTPTWPAHVFERALHTISDSMRNYRLFLLPLLLLFSVALVAPACSKKSGCPAQESLKPKKTKSGNFKSKKSNSELFGKKMRRKMK